MLRHKRSSLTALFCLTLAVSGCAGDPERSPDAQAVADTINVVFHHAKWRQVPATPELQAETIIFEQRVAFAGNMAILDGPGRVAVDRLLNEAAPAPGSLVALSVGGSPVTGQTLDRLTLQRLESIRMALADRGFASALASDPAARVAALGEDEIGLTVAKVTAVLPDCEQSQPLAPNPPDFISAFGCANTSNLSVMVADPADLERGRTLEPADAEAASLSVLRYRIRETEPLEKEDTKSK
jgi:pilus assembly protein CpaD